MCVCLWGEEDWAGGEEGVVGERKSSQLAAYPEKREWALFVGSAEVDPCLFT